MTPRTQLLSNCLLCIAGLSLPCCSGSDDDAPFTTDSAEPDSGADSAAHADAADTLSDNANDGTDSSLDGDAADSTVPVDAFAGVLEVVQDQLVPLVGDDWVLIVERGDDRLFEQASGEFDTHTVVPIASATKWISAAVVLSMVESGTITLDTRAGDVLPIFEQHGKGDLLVRQMFSMTSGLYNRQQRFETSAQLTLEQSVNAIATQTDVAFTPGTRIGYDGKGMQVAGFMTQVLAGKEWSKLAQDRLLVPCGMGATSYDAFSPNTAIAGGIRTSAEDYAAYLRMLARGGVCDGSTILAASSYEVMFTNHADGLLLYKPEDVQWPTDGSYYEDGRTQPEYAFGSWVLSEGSDGQPNELASPGAFGVFPWINRRLGVQALIWVYTTNMTVYEQLIAAEMAVIKAVRETMEAYEG